VRPDDGRSLNEREIEEIQKNVFQGCYHDVELARLFETIRVQRQVLGDLFKLFVREPLRRVSVAQPVLNSQLAHLKELVSMEDERPS
jgi:hypothetical protein